ncbi:hypothetical protein C5O78_12370 [Treponema phagedenis]|nr:hypothetical protein C5O78_12370 [Treponema phagedenis]
MQSFKTRRFGFDKDVKIRTGTDARGSTQQRCFKIKVFAKLHRIQHHYGKLPTVAPCRTLFYNREFLNSWFSF